MNRKEYNQREITPLREPYASEIRAEDVPDMLRNILDRAATESQTI
jgi:uncharacterized protein YukJ